LLKQGKPAPIQSVFVSQSRKYVTLAALLLAVSSPSLTRAQTLGANEVNPLILKPKTLEQAGNPQTISLDAQSAGRTFDGFGAVSGGGNTSRLLPEYPEKQRQEILDYMFKSGFGASLNDLKAEVGGDVNSTQGSEPSHMHTATDENYQRGFEWWLMEEAKKRNPQIILECLAWGAPGWVGNGHYWSNDMMDYYIKFIKGAKQYHGLDITTVGGKNESGYDPVKQADWYIGFRKALDANGLSSVKLVGSDDWGKKWLRLANVALTNSELMKAVDVFGGHVTWSEDPGVPSAEVLATGKPLWDTEAHNYKMPEEAGFKEELSQRTGFNSEISLVHAFNYNYIHAKITKILFWYLLNSTYPECDWPNIGMITANSPWSGHYDVLPVLWGYAHINQFVQPGWRYLENGGNGILPDGGTYTTLLSPKGEFSIIAETQDAKGVQTLHFSIAEGLAVKPLHVWTSDAKVQFVQSADITPVNGAFTVTLAPNTIYSISTTTGQCKGGYPPSPEIKAFPFPYSDNYASYPIGTQARYHFDIAGAFEIAKRSDGRGQCLRQAATLSKSGWGSPKMPVTFLGSGDWKDYSISADACIENTGAVAVIGRVSRITEDKKTGYPPGYTFQLSDTGGWILKTPQGTLASGSTACLPNQWHNLKLSFNGSTVTASIDKKRVATVRDSTYRSGLAGLGTTGNYAEFGNLMIEEDK